VPSMLITVLVFTESSLDAKKQVSFDSSVMYKSYYTAVEVYTRVRLHVVNHDVNKVGDEYPRQTDILHFMRIVICRTRNIDSNIPPCH